MANDPKDAARRFYDIIDGHDVSRLDEVCAPDMVGHAGAGANLDQLKASIGSFVEAFPDVRFEVRYLIGEDDLVSSWTTLHGTHLGEFAGVGASGRTVKFAGWDLFRVRDGRIVELTQFCDLFTALNQMGALPTATPAA